MTPSIPRQAVIAITTVAASSRPRVMDRPFCRASSREDRGRLHHRRRDHLARHRQNPAGQSSHHRGWGGQARGRSNATKLGRARLQLGDRFSTAKVVLFASSSCWALRTWNSTFRELDRGASRARNEAPLRSWELRSPDSRSGWGCARAGGRRAVRPPGCRCKESLLTDRRGSRWRCRTARRWLEN